MNAYFYALKRADDDVRIALKQLWDAMEIAVTFADRSEAESMIRRAQIVAVKALDRFFELRALARARAHAS